MCAFQADSDTCTNFDDDRFRHLTNSMAFPAKNVDYNVGITDVKYL
jgi:hypothetical protein